MNGDSVNNFFKEHVNHIEIFSRKIFTDINQTSDFRTKSELQNVILKLRFYFQFYVACQNKISKSFLMLIINKI